MTKIRIHLAMRNKMFLFFSLLMPMIFLFLFVMIWGKSSPEKISYIFGGILTLTVMGGFWGCLLYTSLSILAFSIGKPRDATGASR